MSPTDSTLEIRIHAVTGTVTTFVQTEGTEIQAILASLHPQRLFTQPQIALWSPTMLSVFRATCVSRLDVTHDALPDFPFPQNIDDISLISEDEFHTRYDPAAIRRRRQGTHPEPGEHVTTLAEAEMVGLPPVFLELAAVVRPRLDRELILRHLLAVNSLPFRIEGGMGFLNTQNMARFTMYPGPPDVPPTVWKAEVKALER